MVPKPKLSRDVPRTVDLRPGANLFQALLILVFSVVGAIVGFQAFHSLKGPPGFEAMGKWIAAAGGGVLGMLVGTLVSGFILMFLPQTIATIDHDASINKYRRHCRRLNTMVSFCIIGVAVLLVWLSPLPLPAPDWLFLPWLVPMLVCYTLAQYHCRVLDLWLCPNCDHCFGRPGPYTRFPHHCDNCRYAIESDSDDSSPLASTIGTIVSSSEFLMKNPGENKRLKKRLWIAVTLIRSAGILSVATLASMLVLFLLTNLAEGTPLGVPYMAWLVITFVLVLASRCVEIGMVIFRLMTKEEIASYSKLKRCKEWPESWWEEDVERR